METIFSPTILSLMPTWQCPASCKDCGTFSTPRTKTSLELSDMLAAIDKAKEEKMKLVVFTGGEATLRWLELLRCISHATKLALSTRLVTNAWWASTDDKASRRLKELRQSGLTEINFSTGDEHARFINISNITRTINYALNNEFEPHVMIETRADSYITRSTITDSAEFQKIPSEKVSKVTFTESPWMPLSPNEFASYPAELTLNKDNLGQRMGCESIFSTLTLQANGVMASCCGMGIQKLKSLQLGVFDSNTTSFSKSTAIAQSDLIKLLIRQIGPEKILAKTAKLNPEINWENIYAHKCQACVRVLSDQKILDTISENEEKFIFELASSIAIDKILTNGNL